MGANATTKVPSYAAGQVLTAADLSITNSGIPVFANSTDRTNSFGGTGEKTLAEGQFAYLEDDNKTYYYDGSAWQIVGSTGFAVVKAETAISAASSVTADGVFTSTYTNYRINLVYNTSTTNDVSLKLRASGTSASTSYNRQTFTSTSTTNTGANATGQTSFLVGPNSNGTRRCYATIDVSGPQTSDQTSFQVNVTLFQGDNSGRVFLIYGMHDATSAYDGFELLVASGTFSGSYTVYGYGKTL